MIDIKDKITLSDDNTYGVVSKAKIDNITYYYLVDVNKNENIKFCYEDSNENEIELVEVEDKNLIQKLIQILTENIKNEITNLIN